ncbi:MAG: hypothetical protein R6X02_34560 [Enhygromyxa sp.]
MSKDNSTTHISLADGRNLAIAREERSLRITDREGVVELEIELRERGPIVRVRAAALQVETQGEIALGCDRFELRAKDGIRLATTGDLSASVSGDIDCRAAGHAHWEGKAVRLRARRGEARLEAHDDVRVEGERILLNS